MKSKAMSVIIILSLLLLVNSIVASEEGLIAHWPLKSDGKNAITGAGDFIIPDSGATFESIDGHAGISLVRGTKVYKPGFNLNLGEKFTLAMFVKSGEHTGFEILLAKGRKDEASHFEIYLESGNFNFYVPSMTDFRSEHNINDDILHHLAISYDGHNLVFYVDGQDVKSIEFEGAITGGDSEAVLLGQLADDTFHFEGFISDVRMYNRALSKGEIENLMDATEESPKTGVSLETLVFAIMVVTIILTVFRRRQFV